MKNDEISIQLRDEMKDTEILEAMHKVAKVHHRLIQISITAGATAAHNYLAALWQATQALQTAILVLEQANHPNAGGLIGVEGGRPTIIRHNDIRVISH